LTQTRKMDEYNGALLPPTHSTNYKVSKWDCQDKPNN
jgi:hypothetical protein